MDIFLNDKTSLHLLREVSRNRGLMLLPSDIKAPEPLPLVTVKPDKLDIPNLLSYLQVPEKRKLGLLVPSGKDRIRAKGISCTVDKRPRGEAPFLLLSSCNDSSLSTIVPTENRVFVLAPANVALCMARRLRKRELAGTITHQQAVLLFVKLCLELCGTYTHDPFDPYMGAVTYGTTPQLTTRQLRDFLAPEGREVGLALAREGLQYVYDNSGSPQESFLGPALFGDRKLGGLALCDFAANEPLDLSLAERANIGNRTITPDFQLKRYKSVVEFLGSVHLEGDNPRIDHIRSLDYQTLGIREFDFNYDDVRTQEAFMESAARIVAVMAQYDGPDIRRWFTRLRYDASFKRKQRALFEVFRPWLRT